jgi:hypothetical protein
MAGNYPGKAPLTFSVVDPLNIKYLPWSFETLNEAAILGNLTAEQVKGILFQIVWAVAALQSKFPGLSVVNLASHVKLYKLYKVRYFVHAGVAFAIPANVPLPIIFNLDTIQLEQDLRSDNMIKDVSDVFVNEQKEFDASRQLRRMSEFTAEAILNSDIFAEFVVDVSTVGELICQF